MIRILDRELHEVASAPIALPAYQLASPQGPDIRYRLPLETLQAGQYVLRLDTTDGGNAGRRELRFELR